MADSSSRLGIYDELEKQEQSTPKPKKTKIVIGVLILLALVGVIIWKVVF